MQLTEKHREYWHKNLTHHRDPAVHLVRGDVRDGLLRPRAYVQLLRLAVRFCMAAQGSLIIYVVIIWYYARYMNNLDREYDVHEGEDE